MLPFDRKLKPLARNLRANMTDAAQLIWSKLRKKQIGNAQFYRQKNIGHYIVDFYCPKGKLIIEVDGGQHYETEGIKKRSGERAISSTSWINRAAFFRHQCT
jgi:very-short-patch-repair endonuclease